MRLIYSRFTFHPPRRGDIAIMTHPDDPSRDIIKRVIGLTGDVIEIEQGQVVRNGEMLHEAYVVNGDRRSVDAVEVPPDSYYVLGDNRQVSSDSRAWGFMHKEDIIGRAWLSYWPSDRLEFLQPLW
ncbi:MAG: signal peptidase I [Chloroflexi bacterium]|nr:signal peptidase I [Chloroflexota bacterium]